MRSNYRRLGDFIRPTDERNAGNEVKELLGLSISKEFIPSVANTIGTDMENYKIIRKNQFACSLMQVRRDGKMPIALLSQVDEAIISQAYPTFEVKDIESILPDYLMMWFTRSEFDREACFNAIGGVRGSLEWEDFCNMQLPIPSPAKQREVVAEYNTIQNRIKLNQQIIQKLEETAQAIYKQWFVDFEFPDEEGKPYKSNGGEMVESELGEIPKGWKTSLVRSLANLKYGRMLDSSLFLEKGYPIFSGYGVRGFHSEYMYEEPQILVLCRGVSGTGEVRLSPSFSYITNLSIIVETKKDTIKKMYLFYFLKNGNLRSLDSGSAQSQITTADLYSQIVLHPPLELQSIFDCHVTAILSTKETRENELKLLSQLSSTLLSKLATIEG